MNLPKRITQIALVFGLLFSINNTMHAHCEIPCGIYGDSVRVTLLYEHIATIEKSMNQINDFSEAEEINYNQLMRWVINKEEHAEKIQEIVSQYFLHQRIKIKDASETEAYNKYVDQLILLHKLSVYSMKSKQTTDLQFIDKMRDTLHSFEHIYFE